MTREGQVAIEGCYGLVRRADHDRYLSTLLAPAARRDSLMVLYAFNVEIARVSEVVSEPMLGEIRLQWWREALEAIANGQASGHEVALAIDTLHRVSPFPLALCRQLIDARARDLSDEPFADMEALQDYAAGTSGSLMRMAGQLLKVQALDTVEDQIIAHAGLAYAYTGLMRALPFHASQGRIDLPLDLMGRCDVDPHDILSGRMTPGLRLALDELIERAHEELAQARAKTLSGTILPAVLPASLCDAYLNIIAAPDFDPFTMPCDVAGFRRQLRLLGRLWRKKI